MKKPFIRFRMKGFIPDYIPSSHRPMLSIKRNRPLACTLQHVQAQLFPLVRIKPGEFISIMKICVPDVIVKRPAGPGIGCFKPAIQCPYRVRSQYLNNNQARKIPNKDGRPAGKIEVRQSVALKRTHIFFIVCDHEHGQTGLVRQRSRQFWHRRSSPQNQPHGSQ